jgi:hypothetical protein
MYKYLRKTTLTGMSIIFYLSAYMLPKTRRIGTDIERWAVKALSTIVLTLQIHFPP